MKTMSGSFTNHYKLNAYQVQHWHSTQKTSFFTWYGIFD